MSSTNGIGSLTDTASQITPASSAAAAGKEQQVKTSSAVGTAETKKGGAVDQTDISSTSELLSAALNGSDVRLDKVLPLQRAIADGTYNVSSQDVAEKLISSLLR